MRPVFLWADEAQNFVTEFDAEYQAVARSAGGCTVYLTQNRESYRRVLGNSDAVDSLLGNLQAKFFCQNSGETNEWAAKLLGERWLNVTSTNVGRSRFRDGQPKRVLRRHPQRAAPLFCRAVAFHHLKARRRRSTNFRSRPSSITAAIVFQTAQESAPLQTHHLQPKIKTYGRTSKTHPRPDLVGEDEDRPIPVDIPGHHHHGFYPPQDRLSDAQTKQADRHGDVPLVH